jgi:uncharacterized protein
VELEWDTAKEAANIAKHGFGFSLAVRVFADPRRVVFDVSRPGDGEARTKAVGRFDGKLHALVFTTRGARLRIISLRRANDTERRAYDHRPKDL